jgi:hypothetical protein
MGKFNGHSITGSRRKTASILAMTAHFLDGPHRPRTGKKKLQLYAPRGF